MLEESYFHNLTYESFTWKESLDKEMNSFNLCVVITGE